MDTLKTILIVAAFLLTLLASFGIGAPRVQLGWLGLALFILTFILSS